MYVCVCVCARARDFKNEYLVAEYVAHSLASIVRKNGYSEFILLYDLVLKLNPLRLLDGARVFCTGNFVVIMFVRFKLICSLLSKASSNCLAFFF